MGLGLVCIVSAGPDGLDEKLGHTSVRSGPDGLDEKLGHTSVRSGPRAYVRSGLYPHSLFYT